MSSVSSILLGVAAVLSAAAALVTALHTAPAAKLAARHAAAADRATHTSNGQPLGQLAENQEARYIIANIAPEDQTAAERGYVERNGGSEGSTTP